MKRLCYVYEQIGNAVAWKYDPSEKTCENNSDIEIVDPDQAILGPNAYTICVQKNFCRNYH